jgi:hypothetical protein
MADRWAFIWAYTFGTRRALLEKHEETGAVRAVVTRRGHHPGYIEEVERGGMADPISDRKNTCLILKADPPDAFERDLVERGGFTSKEAALIASTAK